jgi:hypothetical protein
MQPWVLAALLFVGLLALNISFILSARAIRRDATRRFADLERRLETRALAIVNHLFDRS